MDMPHEQVSDGGFEPLAKGGHVLRLAKIEKKTASSGNDYAMFEFETLDGDKLVFHNLNLWHRKESVRHMALRDLDQLCAAFGVDRMQITKLEELQYKVLKAKIVHQEYNGKTYARIDDVKPAPEDVAASARASRPASDDGLDNDDLPW